MLILRIKQAESALADGRLDEAFDLVLADNLRQHQRGQQLLGRLARALAERGQDHLARKRLPQALADCNKAEKLAGNLPVIAELRMAICRFGSGKNQQQHQRAAKLAKAREHINKGWLSVGEQILDGAAGDGGAADILLEQAATQRLEIEAAARKAQEALQRGDLEVALEVILQTGPSRHHNKKLADLAAHIKTLAAQKIRAALNRGRIDQGQYLLRMVAPVTAESLELQELEQVFGQLRRVGACIENGRPSPAAHILRQLKTILSEADWLDGAIGEAERAAPALESLRTGPLAWVMPGGSDRSQPSLSNRNEVPIPIKDDQKSEDLFHRDDSIYKNAAEESIPVQFVIQVDGVGSFLVWRDRLLTLGAISSSPPPDIGLVAEPDMPMVTIERVDEDYFIHSGKPVNVNRKPVTEKLLADNDSIALSPRCSLKFQLPNAASTTARLAFSGARLPRLDIRHAILLDREIIIGPGPSAHIRVERSSESLVLFLQDGHLFCRTKETIEVDGRARDRRIGLPMQVPIKIGQISLVFARL